MKDHAHPPISVTNLLQSGAAATEQIRDRLQSNANMLRRNTPAGDIEPSVELTVDEALLMADNADRVAQLLRKVAEGEV